MLTRPTCPSRSMLAADGKLATALSLLRSKSRSKSERRSVDPHRGASDDGEAVCQAGRLLALCCTLTSTSSKLATEQQKASREKAESQQEHLSAVEQRVLSTEFTEQMAVLSTQDDLFRRFKIK